MYKQNDSFAFYNRSYHNKGGRRYGTLWLHQGFYKRTEPGKAVSCYGRTENKNSFRIITDKIQLKIIIVKKGFSAYNNKKKRGFSALLMI